MREPSFSWTRWSSRSCSSIALYIFTGAFTRPNEMLPDQIARGMSCRYPAVARRKTGVPRCARVAVRRRRPALPAGRPRAAVRAARKRGLVGEPWVPPRQSKGPGWAGPLLDAAQLRARRIRLRGEESRQCWVSVSHHGHDWEVFQEISTGGL